MAKTKISEFNSNPALNTDIDSINISEGCAPSGINDAIRELMSQLKDFQTGAQGDSFGGPVNGALNGTIGATTPNTGAFTTLTTTGNVGTGVTPSSWASAYKAYQVGSMTSLSDSGTGNTQFASNWYNSASGEKYIANGYATMFRQVDGKFLFFTAASGTAGNAISFTQAMTLDASGNLGVGTTSPGMRLDVDSGASSGAVARIRSSSYNSSGMTFNIGTDASCGLGTVGAVPLFFNTNNTERARIDSSGNLLIGTTSGAGKLRVNGGAGTTPALYAANFNNTSGDYAAVLNLGSNSNNTSSLFLIGSEFGVANRFVIYGNGVYATVSDQRLKKNIETARDGYIDDLMRLRVVKYNWTSQEDGEAKEIGVIAQELEQVFSGLVQELAVQGTDTAYKQIKASVLPFILLKAIQEQQVQIQSLKTRLDAANL